MKKKLSVVIPTLNRYEYLRRTIQFLLPQISRNQSRVELVICTNACTDKTASIPTRGSLTTSSRRGDSTGIKSGIIPPLNSVAFTASCSTNNRRNNNVR